MRELFLFQKPNLTDFWLLHNLGREHPLETLKDVVDGNQLSNLAHKVWDIHVDETVINYIVRLVQNTRKDSDLALGASARGSLALYRASQALAAIRGRDYVIPDEVKYLAPAVLSHRCIMRPESSLRGMTVEDILARLLGQTELELGEF